jgi:hypothetical protein
MTNASLIHDVIKLCVIHLMEKEITMSKTNSTSSPSLIGQMNLGFLSLETLLG